MVLRTLLIALAFTGCETAEPEPVDLTRLTCTTPAVVNGSTVEAWRGTVALDASATVAFALDAAHEGGFHPDEPDTLDVVLDYTWDSDALRMNDVNVSIAVSPRNDLGAGLYIGTFEPNPHSRIELYCWSDDWAPPHTYADGACTDADGVEGRAAVPVPVVRETGLGQCVDFGTANLEEDDLGYPVWLDFDLRGADLSEASMHFAYITDAQLEGAQMDGLDYGYCGITGSVDAHTTLPTEGCSVDGSEADCLR